MNSLSISSESDYNKGLENFMLTRIKDHKYFLNASTNKPLQHLSRLFPGALICEGLKCPYSKACPVIQELKLKANGNPAKMVEYIGEIEGTKCRVEQVEAVELFVGLVNSLNIEPDNTADLLAVSDIIINQIFCKRIDRDVAITGMRQSNPFLIHQSTGVVTRISQANELLKIKAGFETAKNKALSALNASRKDQTRVGGNMESFLKFKEALEKGQPINTEGNVILEGSFKEVVEE